MGDLLKDSTIYFAMCSFVCFRIMTVSTIVQLSISLVRRLIPQLLSLVV